MTQGNLPKKGFALSARRLTLLASVAAVGTALMLAGPNTNWSQLFNASSASAADSTAQHPAGFADLVAKVKPAVISVRVKIPASAAPAMMKNTPLSVTIAIVEAKAKTSEAKPSAISKTPKATMAPHLPRNRSIAAPKLCGARLGFIVLDMALLRIDE